MFIPTTFKDISAFFENKILEPKKMVRAKRSLPLNRYIPKDLSDLKIISSTEEESTVFRHQIKRIKKTHEDEERSSEQLLVMMDNITVPKRWIIFLIFLITIVGYLYVSNMFRLSSFIHLQNYLLSIFSRRFNEPIHTINRNCIYQYGQNRFSALLDLFVTFIGQIFFRIDKYENKNDIVYVATSTYEHAYDWFTHLFKKQYI